MTDNDTVQKDGQEVPTPRTGLRASNTLETLRPREVNIPAYAIPQPLQGRGLPPMDFEDEVVRKTDDGIFLGRVSAEHESQREIARIKEAIANAKADNRLAGLPAGNVLPVDWPTAEETMGFQEVERAYGVLQLPLTERVLWLEEQVSGLLDRIAIYNTKSSHKL